MAIIISEDKKVPLGVRINGESLTEMTGRDNPFEYGYYILETKNNSSYKLSPEEAARTAQQVRFCLRTGENSYISVIDGDVYNDKVFLIDYFESEGFYRDCECEYENKKTAVFAGKEIPIHGDINEAREVLMCYEYAINKIKSMPFEEAKASKYFAIKKACDEYFTSNSDITSENIKELVGEKQFKKLEERCLLLNLDHALVEKELRDPPEKITTKSQYLKELEEKNKNGILKKYSILDHGFIERYNYLKREKIKEEEKEYYTIEEKELYSIFYNPNPPKELGD